MQKIVLFFLTISSCVFSTHCPFCDPEILKKQAFYEDELVIALYDYRPIFPGHSLIIPKRHVERFEMLTEEEISQIGKTIKKVNDLIPEVFHTSSYLIAEKNGKEVGQSVPHIHFHYIPRKAGENSLLYFIWRSCLAQIKKPLNPSQMKEIVQELKEVRTDLVPPAEKKK